MIIAIDGPSGSGKSTIAKALAKGFNVLFISSGAIYRALSFSVIKQNMSDDSCKLLELKDFNRLNLFVKEQQVHILYDDAQIDSELSNQTIAKKASQIAKLSNIRQIVNGLIRKIGLNNDCVVEGRDIATTVFKDAFLKIFLDASIKVRATRRFNEYNQMQKAGASLDELIKQMQLRDDSDRSREQSPLKIASDAIAIDTSSLNVDQVLKLIVLEYKKKIKKSTGCVTKLLKKSGARFIYRIVQNLSHYFFRLFYKLEIHGVDNFLNCQDGVILAANHNSFFDPPIIGASCPKEIYFLAQDYLFKVPVLSKLIKKLNSYPVSGKNQGDFFVLKQIIALLKKKKKVVVFPEGSRSYDGNLQEFKQGVALLSLQSNASILPIYIDGVHKVWPRGRKFFKPYGRFSIFFGKEIKPKLFLALEKKEARKLIMSQLRDQIGLLEKKCTFISCIIN